MEEGGSWETFDSMSAVKKWSTDKVSWATEKKGPRSCKWMLILSVMMTDTMRKKNFLKMGTKKDICFLLIPNKIKKNF